MNEVESEAIIRLKRGDINGLETLVQKYQVRALRAAYAVTRDHSMAEDAVQTAFLRVYERIGQFDSGRPFGPWFFRIVLNDAAKAVARTDREVSLDDRDGSEQNLLAGFLADSSSAPEDLAEQAETRRAIWEALGRLPSSQRAVIVARYYLGLSEADMVRQMERAPGTVKWLLHAARNRLRKSLGYLHAGKGDPELLDRGGK